MKQNFKRSRPTTQQKPQRQASREGCARRDQIPMRVAQLRGKVKPKRPQNGFISRGIKCAQTQLSQITRSGVD
jgi:hypothetical protein